MLQCARTLLMGLGVLAVATTVFQIFVVRNMLFSIEMRKCVVKRERYAATVRDTRVYPRTVSEIIDDYRGTQCDVADSDILHVNRTVQNRILQRCRYLIEPNNAENFCDSNTYLLVFIMSAPADFETRRVVRETWAHPRNLFHPSLVNALPGKFRTAFEDPAMRERFGIRTMFVLGTDERVAAMNEAAFDDDEPTVSTSSKSNDRDRDQYQDQNEDGSRTLLSVKTRLDIAKRRRDRSAALRIERGVFPALDDAVRAESERYGDILQGAFVDSYANLTVKVLVAAKWIAARCSSARFAMKIDTDTLPNLPALVASLIERDLLESGAEAFAFPSYYSSSSTAAESSTSATDGNVSGGILKYMAHYRNHTALISSSACGTATAPASASSFAFEVELNPDSYNSNSLLFQHDQPTDSQTQLQSQSHVAPPSQAKDSVESPPASQTFASGRVRAHRLSQHQYAAHNSAGPKLRTLNDSASLGSESADTTPRCTTASVESIFYNRFYSPMMIGYRYGVSSVHRSGRWGVNYDAYPFSSYPNYLAGTSYVLSIVAVHEVYHLALHYRYFFGIEDAYVTGVLGSVIRARKYDDYRFSPYDSRKPSVCQLVRGDRVTATNFALDELIDFWHSLTDSQLQC